MRPSSMPPLSDPVTRVFAHVMYALRNKERLVRSEVAHRPDGPLTKEEARRFQQVNRLYGNPYFGNSMGYIIGGAAPVVSEVREAVRQALRVAGDGKVRAQEGLWSPGAIGEGWHVILHRRRCPRPQECEPVWLRSASLRKSPQKRVAEYNRRWAHMPRVMDADTGEVVLEGVRDPWMRAALRRRMMGG